jgi:hypothetical protein
LIRSLFSASTQGTVFREKINKNMKFRLYCVSSAQILFSHTTDRLRTQDDNHKDSTVNGGFSLGKYKLLPRRFKYLISTYKRNGLK